MPSSDYEKYSAIIYGRGRYDDVGILLELDASLAACRLTMGQWRELTLFVMDKEGSAWR
jgi:hypothetical protein